DSEYLRVRFFSSSIVQVTISRLPTFEDFSYAVCASPQHVNLSHEDNSESISVWSGHLKLVVRKNPVAFTFLDHAGTVLNKDDASLGVSWIGEQVTNYKELQPGERFIGLGEKTGPLDRKGAGYQ